MPPDFSTRNSATPDTATRSLNPALKFSIALACLVFSAISAKNFLHAATAVSTKSNALSQLEGPDLRARLADFSQSDDVDQLRSVAAYEAGRGEQAAAQNQKIEAWCNSLAFYGKALVKEPYASRTLLNWANIRQLLGSVECKQPFASGNFADVATFAIKQDPSNVNNRYIAGLLLYWSGKEEQAAQEFEFVLRYGVALDEVRRNQIFSIASKPELLQKTVPSRIPQGVQYLAWFQQQYSKGEFWSERLAQSKEFSAFKADTLDSVSTAVNDRTIPQETLMRQIMQFDALDLSAPELQRVNGFYEKLFRSDKDSDFLELVRLRLAQTPLPAQIGYVPTDTRMTKTAINNWGGSYDGVLDAYHASVGIFTRAGDIPGHIEIDCGQHESIDMQPLQLQLYVSDDNLAFNDVTQETAISSVRNGLDVLFSLDTSKVALPATAKGRYWKVHFNASSRQSFCRGPLKDLVRVYGKAIAAPIASATF